MIKKIIILGVVLSLIPATSFARGHNTKSYNGLRHVRLARPYRGHVTIYNP